MIWIVLAALGVPLWLVAGALLGALWNRRRVRRIADTFPCKVRALSGNDGPEKWGRSTAWGRWVHNVLLVHKGPALARSDALSVRDVQGPVTRRREFKVRGEDPVSIRLSLDDGSAVEVAAPISSTSLLSGPFLVLEAEHTR
jgi:hypothetical protein